MLIGSILLQMSITLAAVHTESPAIRTLDSLVGQYELHEAGQRSGSLLVRSLDDRGDTFEIDISLGHPDIVDRTVLTMVPVSDREFRVTRSDVMHDFLDTPAEAHVAGNGLLFDFSLQTRTGERLLFQDQWAVGPGHSLTISTTVWPTGATHAQIFRVLEATPVE